MTPRQLAFLGFAILLLMPLAYFAFRDDVKITNYPPRNQKVVAFGDSLIEGVGSSPGNDFVSVVGRSIGVEIVNKGKGGDTTESALVRVGDVLAEESGIVILLLGGNDALRRGAVASKRLTRHDPAGSKKETFENLSTIIERFQGAGAVVVLLGVRGGILSDGYEEDYQALSKKYNTAYVSDVLDGLIGNAKYMYDGIHPNDAGYTIIADRVAPVLQKLLQ